MEKGYRLTKFLPKIPRKPADESSSQHSSELEVGKTPIIK
jgi:hypothetical protein